MRQLVVLSFALDPEGEKVSINDFKEATKEIFGEKIKEKKIKVDLDSFQIHVLDQEKYLSYFDKCKKQLSEAYKVSYNFPDGIDSKYYGSRIDLTLANNLYSNPIPDLNYRNESGKKANIFLIKICESQAEEKAIRSITNDSDSNYSKYTYVG